MPGKPAHHEKDVSTYCYQCVAGPDLLKVRVEDGVATEVTPNFDAATIHPAGGRVCVKAFGLVQKSYNPSRVLYPMKRTNPKKGRHEDPGFVRISWEEALTLVADKLNAARAKGLTDETGYPRVAASFGGGGTPTAYMGTLPALQRINGKYAASPIHADGRLYFFNQAGETTVLKPGRTFQVACHQHPGGWLHGLTRSGW